MLKNKSAWDHVYSLFRDWDSGKRLHYVTYCFINSRFESLDGNPLPNQIISRPVEETKKSSAIDQFEDSDFDREILETDDGFLVDESSDDCIPCRQTRFIDDTVIVISSDSEIRVIFTR